MACKFWGTGQEINVLIEGIKGIKSEFPWFEPKKSFIQQGLNEKTGMFLPVFSSLLPIQVENIVDQDLVIIFELLSKWDWEANRSL